MSTKIAVFIEAQIILGICRSQGTCRLLDMSMHYMYKPSDSKSEIYYFCSLTLTILTHRKLLKHYVIQVLQCSTTSSIRREICIVGSKGMGHTNRAQGKKGWPQLGTPDKHQWQYSHFVIPHPLVNPYFRSIMGRRERISPGLSALETISYSINEWLFLFL